MKKAFLFTGVISIISACLIGCSDNGINPTAMAESEDNSIMALVGTRGATDVGVSAGRSKSVWAVSRESAPEGGYFIYRWSGSTWQKMSGAGIRIDVDLGGDAWVVNSNYDLFKYSNGSWIKQTQKARDVGIGGDGSVWVISNEKAAEGGYHVYKLSGSSWVKPDVEAAGVAIDVDLWGIPWVVNSNCDLFRKNPVPMGAWEKQAKKARDVGIWDNGDAWIISDESAPSGGFRVYSQGRESTQWQSREGAGVAISSGWLINSSGDIFEWNGSLSYGKNWIKR